MSGLTLTLTNMINNHKECLKCKRLMETFELIEDSTNQLKADFDKSLNRLKRITREL